MASIIDFNNWQFIYKYLQSQQRDLLSKFDRRILCIWFENNNGPYTLKDFAFVETTDLTPIEEEFLKTACSLSNDYSYTYDTKQNYLWTFEKEIDNGNYWFLDVNTYKVSYPGKPFEITRPLLNEWNITESKLSSLKKSNHVKVEDKTYILEFFKYICNLYSTNSNLSI